MDDDDEPAVAIIAEEATMPSPSDHLPASEEQSSLHVPSSLEQIPPFVPEQRVFCQDKGNLYEAVIKQNKFGIVAPNKKQISASNRGGSSSQLQQPQWSYLVHFPGWNTRYDKWVKHEDILPDTEEHRARLRQQQQLQWQLSTTMTPNATTTTNSKPPSKRKASDASTPTKKQRRDVATSATGGQASTADYCELPFTLQTVLVEEWEHITRANHLGMEENHTAAATSSSSSASGWRPLRNIHHLPASVTIRQVLQHFAKLQSSVLPKQQQQQPNRAEGSAPDPAQEAEEKERQQALQQQHRRRVKDFIQDLMALFDDALPVCLLYPQERPQWESLKAKETFSSACDVYGAEFLLRLVVRLPVLMPTVRKDVGQILTELIVMLQKNRNVCFKGNYREPLPDELLDWEREWMHQPFYSLKNSNAPTTATETAPQRL